MNERSQKLEAVFHAVIELNSPAEREHYLAAACNGDPELRREVDDLLKSAEGADAVFQAGQDACRADNSAPAAILIEKPGNVIGRYKLLEKIGEGGMGVVYMAEQEQPVRRRVALKIIKLGMDTRQVVARFEAERQALALMDHPNIAKVLDAGATDTGRPFFVMELVQGVPITEFCDQNQLSAKERIRLFIPVCQAIQSAHQKGIIHRDLKPSNVLVTHNGGVPHPMVIDFGVAKATNQKLTEKTLFTNFATMIGTPAYMSPEQAEMSKLDVDTRSDIYSLGVLLYELLAGTTPFPEKRLRSVAYREMQRIIVEEEPERPSTRLTKTLAASSASASARSAVRSSHSAIDPDLDWIVMKCLEKDRARRYETANGLAADLKRHLGNEPVIARPPGTTYRFQKMVRRNKVAFGAAVAVATALLAGTAVSAWQAIRATRAERVQIGLSQKAEREAAMRKQAAEFLADAFANFFRRVDVGTDTAMMREILDQAVERLDSHTPTDDNARATLGVAYWAIGEDAKANVLLREALAIAKKQLPPNHHRIHWRVIKVVENLVLQGKLAEAEMLLNETYGSTGPMADAEKSPGWLGQMGDIRARQGKWKEAAEDFARGARLEPANHEWQHKLAPLLIQNGELMAYNEHRQNVLSVFGGTVDPIIAERMAKDCLILPLAGPDLNAISKLADVAVAAGTNHWAWTWFQLVKALAEYRQEHFDGAVEWGQKVLTKAGEFPQRDVQACMILAMAHYHLQHADEARAALAKGNEIAQTKLSRLESRDIGDDWPDWIIAHVLMDEARALIRGSHTLGKETK